MLHALEVRSPFMDHELVQFAAEPHQRPSFSKAAANACCAKPSPANCPPQVFTRPKMGFAVPIGKWFRSEPGRDAA